MKESGANHTSLLVLIVCSLRCCGRLRVHDERRKFREAHDGQPPATASVHEGPDQVQGQHGPGAKTQPAHATQCETLSKCVDLDQCRISCREQPMFTRSRIEFREALVRKKKKTIQLHIKVTCAVVT